MMAQVDNEKSKCACPCHPARDEAMKKMAEARKNKTFYYYHCDCYCCWKAYGFSFGLTKENKCSE